MIEFSNKTNLLSLHTDNTSYVMQFFRGQHLLHLYWGKRITMTDRDIYFPLDERVNMVHSDPADKSYHIEDLPFEYSFWGKGDFRSPSLSAVDGNGAVIPGFIYESHIISKGKPEISGLPSTFAEEVDKAETLEIRLVSPETGLKYYFYIQFSPALMLLPELSV